MVKATFSREEWEALALALPHNAALIQEGIERATGGRLVGPRALIGVVLPNQLCSAVLTKAGRMGFCINVRSA